MSKAEDSIANQMTTWKALKLFACAIILKLWLPTLLVLLWCDSVTLRTAVVSALSVLAGSIVKGCEYDTALQVACKALKVELERR